MKKMSDQASRDKPLTFYVVTCRVCEKKVLAVDTGGRKAEICSRECGNEVQRIASRVKYIENFTSPPCKMCGCDINIQPGERRRLCEPCQSKAKASGRSKARAMRRARKKAVACESFDPYEIFTRDNWKCQLCGIVTLKKYDPSTPARLAKSPTLDHVIPLSKGGSHTSSNTQLLCSKCNTAKGAKVLSLF